MCVVLRRRDCHDHQWPTLIPVSLSHQQQQSVWQPSFGLRSHYKPNILYIHNKISTLVNHNTHSNILSVPYEYFGISCCKPQTPKPHTFTALFSLLHFSTPTTMPRVTHNVSNALISSPRKRNTARSSKLWTTFKCWSSSNTVAFAHFHSSSNILNPSSSSTNTPLLGVLVYSLQLLE